MFTVDTDAWSLSFYKLTVNVSNISVVFIFTLYWKHLRNTVLDTRWMIIFQDRHRYLCIPNYYIFSLMVIKVIILDVQNSQRESVSNISKKREHCINRHFFIVICWHLIVKNMSLFLHQEGFIFIWELKLIAKMFTFLCVIWI